MSNVIAYGDTLVLVAPPSPPPWPNTPPRGHIGLPTRPIDPARPIDSRRLSARPVALPGESPPLPRYAVFDKRTDESIWRILDTQGRPPADGAQRRALKLGDVITLGVAAWIEGRMQTVYLSCRNADTTADPVRRKVGLAAGAGTAEQWTVVDPAGGGSTTIVALGSAFALKSSFGDYLSQTTAGDEHVAQTAPSPGVTEKWTSAPPTLPRPPSGHRLFRSVSMGADGSILAADDMGTVQRYTGSGWDAVSDLGLVKVAVRSATEVWGFDDLGIPVKLAPSPGPQPLNRQDMPPVWGTFKLRDIDVAEDGTVCGVQTLPWLDFGGNGPAVLSDGTNAWAPLDEQQMMWAVAVGRRDFVWGIDPDRRVRSWEGGAWRLWPALPIDRGGTGRAVDIMAGSHGTVWALGEDTFLYELKGSAWSDTEWGGLHQIGGANAYRLIGLTPATTDRNGDPTNDVWISNVGEAVATLRPPPPPPPPTATFGAPRGAGGMMGFTDKGLAVAVYNRKLYGAYRAADASHVLWMKGASPSEWPNNDRYRGYDGIRMGSAPALAAFKGGLYCAFQGDGLEHTFFVTRSSDGENWASPRGYDGIRIGSAPALAVFNGALYCAFQADDPKHTFFVTRSSDGENWAPPRGYDGIRIGSAPALAVFNGALYCAFQADDPSHTLFVTKSSDGENWVVPARRYPDYRIGGTPALAAFYGKLYCAYQADDGSKAIYITCSADGDTWEPARRYDDVALVPYTSGPYTPALCVVDGRLYLVVTGDNSWITFCVSHEKQPPSRFG